MLLTVGSLLAASAIHVSAAVIVQDDFSGDSATDLNGTAADVGGTWTADTVYPWKADGSYDSTAFNDKSAFIALSGSLETGTIYTLTATVGSHTDSFFYLGLHDAAPSTSSRLQAQDNGIQMEWDAIGDTAANLHINAGTSESRPLTGAYNNTLSMVINTGSDLTTANVDFYSGASLVGSVTYDVTDLNHLVMGWEGGNGAVDIDSVTFSSQAVPEPSSTALIGLAGIGFILRRRR
ncbi:PEP-CTERM protein-sorting domain-containing protein [Rubritalea squalenifaciens DSM 18772]|uniref:PEP-CTERM protein-sorting domain-containing protein n=2 Tax=Rubritalea squalenifaciens TaxID=407226 RepID=A0A1M6SSF0_9BACT|nr:PEP-CTERM protein-sorting domain-containing protein [Rubritalea squalenifaciens DSM 18772]